MMPAPNHDPDSPAACLPELPARDFDRLRRILLDTGGMVFGEAKLALLRNRVGRRLRALGLRSFRDYLDRLEDPGWRRRELESLWTVVTTHETRFFREPQHFEALRKDILPELAARRPARWTVAAWSAGCSTGQEAWSLAATLADFAATRPGVAARVLGSDIDPVSLASAQQGRYPFGHSREIPARHLLVDFDADARSGVLSPRDHLRRMVAFRHQNLSSLGACVRRYDVIFCRNTMMYLAPAVRVELIRNFRRLLLPDGFLFVGAAESLYGMPRLFGIEKRGAALVYRPAPPQEEADAGHKGE